MKVSGLTRARRSWEVGVKFIFDRFRKDWEWDAEGKGLMKIMLTDYDKKKKLYFHWFTFQTCDRTKADSEPDKLE